MVVVRTGLQAGATNCGFACCLKQAELEAANATWQYTAFGRTVHAFTLMENPLWNGSESMVRAAHTCVTLEPYLLMCFIVAPATGTPALCILLLRAHGLLHLDCCACLRFIKNGCSVSVPASCLMPHLQKLQQRPVCSLLALMGACDLVAVQSSAYNPVADRASWWGLRGLLLEQFGRTNMTDPYTAAGNTYDYATGFSGEGAVV